MISSVASRYLGTLTNGTGVHNVSNSHTVDEVLVASHSDYHVGIARLMVAEIDGTVLREPDGRLLALDTPYVESVERSDPQFLPEHYKCVAGDRRITVRENRDGTRIPFDVVRSKYSVTQNSVLVQNAIDLVSRAGSDGAGLMYAGHYEEGRVFFVGSSIGDLTVDIGAYRETFVRTVQFVTGHDGNLAHWTNYTYSDPDTGIDYESMVDRTKHYTRVGAKVETVVQSLEGARAHSESLVAHVQALANVQLPQTSALFERMLQECVNALVPGGEGRDKSGRKRREAEGAIRATFGASRHSGTRGVNGWALYTAYVETREALEGRVSKLAMHQRSLKSSRTANANRTLRAGLVKIAQGQS